MTEKRTVFRARGHEFPLGRKTWIMGIVNVTPDSFSDGGRFLDPEQAVAQALRLVEEGADILDIGGESTRPGHQPVSADEEIRRVVPVLRELKRRVPTALSVDTSKEIVARAALDAGADIVNDVRGLRADPGIAAAAAECGAGLILMYNATPLPDGRKDPEPSWAGAPMLGGRILRQWSWAVARAEAAGTDPDRIVLDPGIGFGVTAAESRWILQHLNELGALGYPLLIGPSRKSFIGTTLDLPVEERLMGTAAAVTLGIARGADFIRVHDVADMRQVAAMTDAMTREVTPE